MSLLLLLLVMLTAWRCWFQCSLLLHLRQFELAAAAVVLHLGCGQTTSSAHLPVFARLSVGGADGQEGDGQNGTSDDPDDQGVVTNRARDFVVVD